MGKVFSWGPSSEEIKNVFLLCWRSDHGQKRNEPAAVALPKHKANSHLVRGGREETMEIKQVESELEGTSWSGVHVLLLLRMSLIQAQLASLWMSFIRANVSPNGCVL